MWGDFFMSEQNKFSVSFKKNDKEQELKDWFLEEAGIIGAGNYIKQMLYKEMLKQKRTTEK